MYKVISTFSGIGGSSTGYKLAGFEVLAAVEFLDYQAANYRLNYQNTKVYQEDIRKLDPLKILADCNLKVGELDVLDGSPPCSSFSTAGSISDGWGKVKEYGNRKQTTDDLFYEYIRFIKEMQPKVFVAENVSGLIKGNSRGMFNAFFREMVSQGYNVKAKVLNAANYGVPQIRQRLIFIGVRSDLGIIPVFPTPNERTVTVKEAFLGLIQSEKEVKERFDFVSKWETVMKYIKKCAPGENASKYHPKKSFFSKGRLPLNKPSQTITANGNSGTNDQFHPTQDRLLTISELKRIHSYQDDYKLIGSIKKQWEGIGRSVPPLMMKAIAECVKTQILERINS